MTAFVTIPKDSIELVKEVHNLFTTKVSSNGSVDLIDFANIVQLYGELHEVLRCDLEIAVREQ